MAAQATFTRCLMGLGIGVGLALSLTVSPATAQSTAGAGALGNINQNKDPFSNPSGSTTGVNGIFDLIHQATLGSGKNSEEFRAEQGENLDEAAQDFRAKQKMLLEQASPAVESKPVAPASSGN